MKRVLYSEINVAVFISEYCESQLERPVELRPQHRSVKTGKLSTLTRKQTQRAETNYANHLCQKRLGRRVLGTPGNVCIALLVL